MAREAKPSTLNSTKAEHPKQITKFAADDFTSHIRYYTYSETGQPLLVNCTSEMGADWFPPPLGLKGTEGSVQTLELDLA